MHPANFFPTNLLIDLEFVMQRAQELSLNRSLDEDEPHPTLHAFPRLAALIDHPKDLTAFWTHALEQGLAPTAPMVRDSLVAYTHEFLQEVIDALMAQHGDVDPDGARRAAESAQELLRSTFHAAFDALFAAEVIGHDVADDADMPGISVHLSRAQQRRVLLQVMQGCVHHAQLHRAVC